MPSRLLPPWFETETAVAPASAAARASSGCVTPLTMNGPSHCSRSQAMSDQVGGGVCIHSTYAEKKVGAACPGSARFGQVKAGTPPLRRNSTSQRGRLTASGP